MKHFTFIFLILILANIVHAKEMVDIYSATINIYQEQGFDKNIVFRKGLENVILKLTGVDSAFDEKQFDFLKNNSNTLVQKYNYRAFSASEKHQWQKHMLRVNPKSGVKVPFASVNVSYAKKPIIDFLKRNYIPYWTNLRPLSLFWIVSNIEERTKGGNAINKMFPQAILNRNSEKTVKDKLVDVAQQLALPFELPLMDYMDKKIARVQTVKDFDVNTLSLASQRYSAFNTVVADIEKYDGVYYINWTASVEQKTYAWDTFSDNLHQALFYGVSRYVRFLLNTLNEGSDGDEQQLKIVVENISDYASLVAIKKYLSKLPKIKNLVLSEFEQPVIIFKAKLLGSMVSLQHYIKLEPLVEVKENAGERNTLDIPLDIDKNKVQIQTELGETLYLVYQ